MPSEFHCHRMAASSSSLLACPVGSYSLGVSTPHALGRSPSTLHFLLRSHTGHTGFQTKHRKALPTVCDGLKGTRGPSHQKPKFTYSLSAWPSLPVPVAGPLPAPGAAEHCPARSCIPAGPVAALKDSAVCGALAALQPLVKEPSSSGLLAVRTCGGQLSRKLALAARPLKQRLLLPAAPSLRCGGCLSRRHEIPSPQGNNTSVNGLTLPVLHHPGTSGSSKKAVLCMAASDLGAATTLPTDGPVLSSSASHESLPANLSLRPMLQTARYVPPKWAAHLPSVPRARVALGHLPTPIHRWGLPGLPAGVEVYIKRDDLTGMELSGNKVRKLEFLLADAVAGGADCVITIGGIQSNHCRATAVAARYLGLDCHLILRTSKALATSDPGLVGNLLVERMVGAQVHLVSKEEYGTHGSEALGQMLLEKLRAAGRHPYLIPVGGSNSLGSWGYIEAVREIEDQITAGLAGGATRFDHIVMACGSGGTTAGTALASRLSRVGARVHGYGVCDDPNYFHVFVQGLLDGLGAGVASRDIVRFIQAKGTGYALSTPEELRCVQEVAVTTGIVLDPVYSGKAVLGLLNDIRACPKEWEGRRVLFIHTGGLLGMYDKIPQLQPMMGSWQRFDFGD